MHTANLLRVIANVMDAPCFDQGDPTYCIIGIHKKILPFNQIGPIAAFAEYLDIGTPVARQIWVGHAAHWEQTPGRNDCIKMLLRLGETGKVTWR